MEWKFCAYADLSKDQLYSILAKRQEVFTVGQGIRYVDADGLDQDAWHLCGWQQDKLVAYLRVLPYHRQELGPCWKIGRVLTCPDHRGQGLGKALMQRCLALLSSHLPRRPLTMSAQSYLIKFYRDCGFEVQGEAYREEGIDHVRMDYLNEAHPQY